MPLLLLMVVMVVMAGPGVDGPRSDAVGNHDVPLPVVQLEPGAPGRAAARDRHAHFGAVAEQAQGGHHHFRTCAR